MVRQRFSDQKVGFLVLCVFFCGCMSTDLPNAGQAGYKLEDDEGRLFKRSEEFIEVLDESDAIYPNPQLEKYLTDLANSLLTDEIKTSGPKIRVRVLKDPSLNAFSLPNGRIYIHVGLLAVMDNEAQLAALLGHEMTHVIFRHAVKNFRSAINKSSFLASISMPIDIVSGGLGSIFAQLAAISSIYGYSKELEYEADENGFYMTAKKNYDVHEGRRLFEHLKAFIDEEDIKEPFFFSDHPHVVARIKNYDELIAQHPQGPLETKTIDSKEFGSFLDNILRDNTHLCFQGGFFKTAERNIAKFIQRNPDAAVGYYERAQLSLKRIDPPKGEKKRDKAPDYEAALKDYNKALELDHDFPEGYLGKAKVLQKQNKAEEAKSHFQKYLQLKPNAPDRAYIEKYITSGATVDKP